MEKIVERESNKEINKEHEHKKQVGFCDDQHQDQNQGTSSKQQLQMLPPKPYYTNTNTNTDGNTPPKPLNPNTNTDVNTSLKHMSYQCPGLSGPGCRMCIEPWSFDKLLLHNTIMSLYNSFEYMEKSIQYTSGTDIEHTLYNFLDKNKIVNIPVLGLDVIKGMNGDRYSL